MEKAIETFTGAGDIYWKQTLQTAWSEFVFFLSKANESSDLPIPHL